jgi:hypothetical protein
MPSNTAQSTLSWFVEAQNRFNEVVRHPAFHRRHKSAPPQFVETTVTEASTSALEYCHSSTRAGIPLPLPGAVAEAPRRRRKRRHSSRRHLLGNTTAAPVSGDESVPQSPDRWRRSPFEGQRVDSASTTSVPIAPPGNSFPQAQSPSADSLEGPRVEYTPTTSVPIAPPGNWWPQTPSPSPDSPCLYAHPTPVYAWPEACPAAQVSMPQVLAQGSPGYWIGMCVPASPFDGPRTVAAETREQYLFRLGSRGIGWPPKAPPPGFSASDPMPPPTKSPPPLANPRCPPLDNSRIQWRRRDSDYAADRRAMEEANATTKARNQRRRAMREAAATRSGYACYFDYKRAVGSEASA